MPQKMPNIYVTETIMIDHYINEMFTSPQVGWDEFIKWSPFYNSPTDNHYRNAGVSDTYFLTYISNNILRLGYFLTVSETLRRF